MYIFTKDKCREGNPSLSQTTAGFLPDVQLLEEETLAAQSLESESSSDLITQKKPFTTCPRTSRRFILCEGKCSGHAGEVLK